MLDSGHTKLSTSRFNAGAANARKFEILYFAETPTVALFEVGVLLGSSYDPIQQLANKSVQVSVVNIDVILQKVVHLTDEQIQQRIGTTAQELTGDWFGYQKRSHATSVRGPVGIAPTQELGLALFGKEVRRVYHLVGKSAVFRGALHFPGKPDAGQLHSL